MKPCSFYFLSYNCICFPQYLQALFIDRSDYADGKTRTGKRLSPDDFFRKSKLFSNCSNLVLKEFSQRLNQLKIMVQGNSTNIVMSLDLCRINCAAFNNVWVQSPLYKEADILHFAGNALK